MNKFRRFLVISFIQFCSVSCFTQGLNFEKGYNDAYTQSPTATLCMDDQTYLGYNRGSFGFQTYAVLVKNDTSGNELWSTIIAPTSAETTSISEIFSTDGGIIVCGEGNYVCDVAGSFGYVMKLTESGIVIWSKIVGENPLSMNQSSLWETGGYSKLEEDKILFEILGVDYSGPGSENFRSIVVINGEGQLTDSLTTEGPIMDGFIQYGDFAYVGHRLNTLYIFDSDGSLLQTIEQDDQIRDLDVVNDQLFVLQSQGLKTFDLNLEVTGEYNFSSIGDCHNLEVTGGEVTFLASNNNDLTQLILLTEDFETSVVNSFQMGINENTVQHYNVSHFSIAEAFALTEQTAVRHLDFSMIDSENATVDRTDAEVVDIVGNEIFIGSEYQDNLFSVGVDASVLVRNNGDLPMTSFKLNKALGWGICNPAYYFQNFANYPLEPDESVWVDIGVVGINDPVYISEGTTEVNVGMCVYSSHPNQQTDLNVENDEACVSLTMTIVGLEDLKDEQLSVYPIPTEDLLFFDNHEGDDLTFEIFNFTGSRIFNGHVNAGPVDMTSLAQGVYFIRIRDRDEKVIFSESIVKN